ncbi:MAG: hypothetical protein U9Q91_05850 [Candidatus Marinimicrobia bacterium]|nr:hypothetical protein [Candidatus Neomarinimicrobiota bacterium]
MSFLKKSILIGFLVLLTSIGFSQNPTTSQMKIGWTADIVLGKGYTTTQTYTVNNSNFVICYNSSTGKTQIWNLDKGGSPLYDKTTHTGWSSMVFFLLNNNTYLFTYKKATGKVIFYKMSDSGIQKRVGEYTWSKGWNGFDVLYRNNKPTIMMTRASDGRAKFFKPYF